MPVLQVFQHCFDLPYPGPTSLQLGPSPPLQGDTHHNAKVGKWGAADSKISKDTREGTSLPGKARTPLLDLVDTAGRLQGFLVEKDGGPCSWVGERQSEERKRVGSVVWFQQLQRHRDHIEPRLFCLSDGYCIIQVGDYH